MVSLLFFKLPLTAESTNEVLDNVVEEYVKKFGKKEKKKDIDEEEADPNEAENQNEQDELFYYSKEDKAFKVFNPRSKKWSA